MPFDRSTFEDATVQTFHQACRHLEKDGQVHAALHAFDKTGRSVLMALARPRGEVRTAEDQKDLDESGVVVTDGPFVDNLPQLADLIRERRAVAALFVAEAWTAEMTDPTDTRAPSEREDREEIVLTYGVWPQQVFARALTAAIVRDPDGNPTTRPRPRGADDGADIPVGWLDLIMPNQHGKYPTVERT